MEHVQRNHDIKRFLSKQDTQKCRSCHVVATCSCYRPISTRDFVSCEKKNCLFRLPPGRNRKDLGELPSFLSIAIFYFQMTPTGLDFYSRPMDYARARLCIALVNSLRFSRDLVFSGVVEIWRLRLNEFEFSLGDLILYCSIAF